MHSIFDLTSHSFTLTCQRPAWTSCQGASAASIEPSDLSLKSYMDLLCQICFLRYWLQCICFFDLPPPFGNMVASASVWASARAKPDQSPQGSARQIARDIKQNKNHMIMNTLQDLTYRKNAYNAPNEARIPNMDPTIFQWSLHMVYLVKAVKALNHI